MKKHPKHLKSGYKLTISDILSIISTLITLIALILQLLKD